MIMLYTDCADIALFINYKMPYITFLWKNIVLRYIHKLIIAQVVGVKKYD